MNVSRRRFLIVAALEEAPVAWLFQYQGIEGVSNRFDYTPNPGESVYAWDFHPKAG